MKISPNLSIIAWFEIQEPALTMALQQLVRTEEALVKKVSRTQIIDNRWTAEIMNKKYATLCRVAKALVTIFHGAQVESTVLVMSKIMLYKQLF